MPRRSLWEDLAVPRDTGPREGDDQLIDDEETALSFAMLLEPSDLPGHRWRIAEERSWPTGQLDPASEKSRRALAFGGVTAWRSFAAAESSRSAWVEVVPYATTEDAGVSLRQVPKFFVGTLRPGERLVAEGVVEGRVLPGVADTWMFEKSTTGPEGDTSARYVGGTIGRILFITCFSSSGAMWPWAEVIELARLQAEKVPG
jgi:hypothetical protein